MDKFIFFILEYRDALNIVIVNLPKNYNLKNRDIN